MYAAAKGNSNIGIPQSVAKKFTEHDTGGKKPESARDMERSDWRGMIRGFIKFLLEESREPEHAEDEDHGEVKRRGAGVLLIEPTGRVLFVRRGIGSDYPGTWCFPGGLIEESDADEASAAVRELFEEVGEFGDCSADQLKPLDRRVLGGTDFTTFVQPVDSTFVPQLSDEHIDYHWADLDDLPEPLHPGVKATLDCLATEAEARKWDGAGKFADDAIQLHNREVPKDYGWAMGGKVGTGRSTTEMSREVKRDIAAIHAKDAVPLMAYDRATVEHIEGVRYHLEFDPTILAYDRDTVRDKDQDGRLHIKRSHISKATVNPYYGKEIPNFEALGLQADKKYMLLRDPEELAKGAATFNNVPILSQHVPLTSKTHDSDLVIGSTGTDAVYEHPYLDNSLVFWPQAAIDAIEDDEIRQLSCCYHYDPDMTPGEYEGQKYDGVMRNIRGNHVALVPEGRAGADVMVMDAMPKPKFALDALPRFEEGKHKRDHGKFTSGGGSSAAGAHRHSGVLASHGFSAGRQLGGGPHGSSTMHSHPEKGTVHLLPNGGWHHQLANGARSGQSAAGLHKSLSEPTGRFKITKNGLEPHEGVQYKPGEVEAARAKFHSSTKTKDAALAGDSKEKDMTAVRLSPGARLAKGALIAYLMPKLAADANIAVTPLLAGINGKNFKEKRGLLATRVKTAVKGKLAADADVDDIADMLESVEDLCRGEESLDEEPAGNANSAVPPYLDRDRDRDNDGARDNVPGLSDEAKQFLQSKLSPEDYDMLCQMHEKPAGDEDNDDNDEGEVHHVGAEAGEEEPDVVVVNKDRRFARDEPPDFEGKPKLVTKEAMDAAIQAAATATEQRVRNQMRSIADAHAEVKPYVGDISHMAFDSAEGVYRHTLKMMGVDGADTIHESALKTILGMQRKTAKKSTPASPLASDAVATAAAGGATPQGSFAERFAATRNIGRM